MAGLVWQTAGAAHKAAQVGTVEGGEQEQHDALDQREEVRARSGRERVFHESDLKKAPLPYQSPLKGALASYLHV